MSGFEGDTQDESMIAVLTNKGCVRIGSSSGGKSCNSQAGELLAFASITTSRPVRLYGSASCRALRDAEVTILLLGSAAKKMAAFHGTFLENPTVFVHLVKSEQIMLVGRLIFRSFGYLLEIGLYATRDVRRSKT